MARRSGTRYLNILRGKRGPSAKTKLLAYLNGDVDLEYPERAGNRPARASVWVRPFVLPLGAGVKLLQFVQSGNDTIVALAAPYVSETAPAEDSKLVLSGVLSPRAAITTGRTAGAGTSETSKISGLKYRKYGGKTISVPFGEGTAADEKSEDAVFLKIRANVKSGTTGALNQCSFVPGSYSV